MNFATGIIFGFIAGVFITVFIAMAVIIAIGFKSMKKGGGYIETTETIDA